MEEKSGETEGQFVVMSTTDVHGKVWDENILNGTAVRNSLLNVSTAVDEYEEKYGKENVILLDNGDLYQGTPVSSYNISQYTQGKTKDINPMALALEQIGFDAAILGNHEFNYPWATMSDIYTVYICTVCNEIYHGNTVAASGHKYKDGVCAVCGEKESEKPEQKPELKPEQIPGGNNPGQNNGSNPGNGADKNNVSGNPANIISAANTGDTVGETAKYFMLSMAGAIVLCMSLRRRRKKKQQIDQYGQPL